MSTLKTILKVLFYLLGGLICGIVVIGIIFAIGIASVFLALGIVLILVHIPHIKIILTILGYGIMLIIILIIGCATFFTLIEKIKNTSKKHKAKLR